MLGRANPPRSPDSRARSTLLQLRAPVVALEQRQDGLILTQPNLTQARVGR